MNEFMENNSDGGQNQHQNQTPANNNMSVAALICGILGIIGGFIPLVQYFTTVLAILAIIFGVKGKKRCPNKGLATAGFVLGIVSLAVSVLGIVCTVCAIGALAGLGTL